ncbi:hypothetical protein BLA24_21390 [Streptomyces cinnamoneus]|uniref:ESX-1 secretion-associated protein n=1 Tax=Streptomyces cinnamoneus TaxID=53446 RepID=A0A2G1XG12_STRCJ|nr:DUF6317 family protein [Streptomyces cinnamoneus]PHQ50141.1 hypothetical protein BLA24_21390 [Streptomyces cinnamoneus]PPT13078.1 hypothetical protein CYQ11_09395 [Streptomyces cinnamoneus]
MSDELRTTVEHIDDAGKGFHREAIHLGEFKHLASPATPGVGDLALSSALVQLSDAFGIAHELLTGLVDRHGTSLRGAAADYQDQDVDIETLFRDMMGKAK